MSCISLVRTHFPLTIFVLLLFFTGILFFPEARAEITLHSSATSLFLGDSIAIDATINSSENVRGFFTVSFVCTKARFEYFRIPLTLESSSIRSIEVEPLQVTQDLFSDSSSCSVIAEYRDFSGDIIQKKSLDSIAIRNTFPIQLSVYDADILPGEFISGTIIVSKPEGKTSHYIYKVIFNGKTLVSEGSENSHSFTLQANKSMLAGNITLFASVVDEFGNEGDDSLIIHVPLLVSRFGNTYTRKTFYANNSDERFGFTPVVYDHMGRKVTDGEVIVTILDPLGNEIASSVVSIGERFSIPVTDSFLSGNYSIITKAGNSSLSESVEIINPLRPIALSTPSSITGLVTADSGILTSSIFWLWVCLVMIAGILGLLIYEYHRRRIREKNKNHYSPHAHSPTASEKHAHASSFFTRFFSWFSSSSNSDNTSSKKTSHDASGFYDEDGYLDLTKDTSVLKETEHFNHKKE